MQPVTDNYEIELPNDKAATYKVVTFIIALINAVAFTYLYFNELNRSNRDFAFLGMTLGGAAFIFYLIKTYTQQLQTFRIEIAFIMLAVLWYLSGNGWLGLPLLVFALLGFYTNKRSVITFSKEGILYPSFPSRLFKWPEVDFVLLKDGILTIELRNNRVLQFTLSKKEAEKLDERGLNDFCSTQTGPGGKSFT